MVVWLEQLSTSSYWDIVGNVTDLQPRIQLPIGVFRCPALAVGVVLACVTFPEMGRYCGKSEGK